MENVPITLENIAETSTDLIRKKDQQIDDLTQQVCSLKRQVEWFQRQLFGRKSEKRLFDASNPSLMDDLFPDENPSSKKAQQPAVTIAAHQRRKRDFPGTPDDSGLRFDESKVEVKEIQVAAPELAGGDASDYDIIRYENTYRLAQRTGSYVVLKYVRPVLKHNSTQQLTTTPAPENVFDKSYADVSFVAGLLIDKFVYHLPLYRQHQRLLAGHIDISRTTLSNLVERSAQLLTPIAEAVLKSILASKLIAMDETPIKAGHQKKKGAKHGQMKTGYFWPVYGDQDEVYFSFSPTRDTQNVHRLLGNFSGTLLTDGYTAYERYVQAVSSVTHARCWSHSRRYIEHALEEETALANEGLDYIAALYIHEDKIKEKGLSGEKKLAYRAQYSKPIVDKFFRWCTALIDRPDLIATESSMLKAVKYALKREQGLRVFLEDPDVPLDTNHIERTLRVIPMGRRNWNFCWTELGAHNVGVIQTLLTTCKLHGVDPYVYLVDVLQRVNQHPASQVGDLIPRVWKEKFGDKPLKSAIDR
jgi:transposase